MARKFAQIKTEIWTDPDWRNLSMGAQWLYMALLSHLSLSNAGVGDWRPKRFAVLSNNATVKQVEKAASELTENGFAFFDADSEEYLIRTFIKHSHLLKSDLSAKGVLKAFELITSIDLSQRFLSELWSVFESDSGLCGRDLFEVYFSEYRVSEPPQQAPYEPPTDTPQNTPTNTPTDTPTDTPQQAPIQGVYEGGSEGGSEGDQGRIKELKNIRNKEKIYKKEKSDKPKKPRRATQLPDDWKPNDKHAEIALTENVNLDEQATLFTDWATAKGATFKDWDAAFRNWLRRANSFTPTKRETKTEQYQRLMTTAATQSDGGGWKC